MSNHVFWFVLSMVFAIKDSWVGFAERDAWKVVFSLLWAFAAGLHFSQVVVPA